MRWHVAVTNVKTRLRIRTGPGLSYRIVDYIYPNKTGIVIDSKTVSGQTWYKWEDTGYWSCGINKNGTKYLTMIYDLTPKEEPKEEPVVTPKKEDPEITYPDRKYTVSDGKDVNKNTGLDGTTSWYEGSYNKASFKDGTNYNVESDEQIAKMIAALKYNMDISYATKNDIYDGYLANSGKGYYSSLQKKLYNSFNRNKTAFPDRDLNKTFAYVFFTRPDLNILETASGSTGLTLTSQTKDDLKYHYLWKNNEWCLKSLVQAGNPYHKFMVLLSNEALSFEVSDIVLKTTEHGETYNGNKIIYGQSDIESNAAGEVSIRYIDTVNLDIFKLHVAWVDYINKVSRGIFVPKRKYIENKILDYASSCYYFLCGADGSTILYWQKLVGVFPVNTGESAFSWDSGTLLAKPEINIKYMYSFKYTMDLHTIAEFNNITSTSKKAKKIMDTEEDEKYGVQTGSTMSHAPRVFETVNSEGQTVLRLVWVDNN